MRWGWYKYLNDGNAEYIFDLRNDPGETSNLQADKGALLLQMRELYRTWEASLLPPIALRQD
jgi:hypothetical protein